MRRILEAAGLAREEEGSPSAGAPRGAAGTRSRSASRIPGVSAYPDDPERRSGAISGVRNSPDPGQEDEFRPDPGGARAIWLAAETCSSEPASAYLAGRGVWPPSRPLPGAVRFLERGAAPFRLRGWPSAAVGAVVYGFARGRQLAAVQLECLDRDGVALAWRLGRSGTAKRKTLGPARGAVFRVAGTRDGDVTVMTESVIDALAVACCPPGMSRRRCEAPPAWRSHASASTARRTNRSAGRAADWSWWPVSTAPSGLQRGPASGASAGTPSRSP